MKASEFDEVAAYLGLSTPAYAEALGIDVRRVRTYSAGTRTIPHVVALAAWALLMQPRVAGLVPEWLK